MNYPKSSRVIVVDDEPEHGIAMLKALAKEGLGALYFSGLSTDELPEQPLNGIRIIITDLRLGTSTGDARNDLGPAVSVLGSLVSPSNGPYIVVAWSQHAEDANEFGVMIREMIPSCVPVAILSLSKNQMLKDGSDEYDIAKIWRSLTDELEKTFPYNVLLCWEQAVHNATDATLLELAKLANQLCELDENREVTQENWCKALTDVVASLIQADGGIQVDTEIAMAASLYSVLNALHTDRLEKVGLEPSPITTEGKQRLVRSKGTVDTAGTAKLNSMLLSENATLTLGKVQPGNVYIRGHWPNSGQDFPLDQDEMQAMVSSLLDINNHPEVKRIKNLKSSDGISEGEVESMISAIRMSIIEFYNVFILELTPSCDYAQAKQKLNRFICGFILPYEKRNYVKKNTDFGKIIGPLTVNGFPEPVIMVLSAQYPAVIKLNTLTFNPITRLRNHVVADIQAWAASQAARVGYPSLTL